MITFELTLESRDDNPGAVEILKKVLLSFGVSIERIIESVVLDRRFLSLYFDKLAHAQDFRKKICLLKLKNIRLKVRKWQSKDWKNKWKQDFKPFQLTKSLKVVPVWLKKDYQRQLEKVVIIDNTMAFGTGQHPTTRFVSEFIEENCQSIETLLDVGTGTGILAIVAEKNGIKKIQAIDMDKYCVQRAASNFEHNKCGAITLRRVGLEFFKKVKAFDCVAANLSTLDLIKYKDKLISLVKPEKYLAISGVSINNYDMLKKEFRKLPLRCLEIRKSEGWMAFLYQRR